MKADISKIAPFVLVALVFFVIVAIKWASVAFHKNLIRKELAKLGVRVIAISWSPRLFFGDKNDTFYDASMQLPSGRAVRATCKCNIWHGVYWESTPWAADLIREPQPQHRGRGTSRTSGCTHCGYELDEDWVACPKCGNKVA